MYLRSWLYNPFIMLIFIRSAYCFIKFLHTKNKVLLWIDRTSMQQFEFVCMDSQVGPSDDIIYLCYSTAFACKSLQEVHNKFSHSSCLCWCCWCCCFILFGWQDQQQLSVLILRSPRPPPRRHLLVHKQQLVYRKRTKTRLFLLP